MQLDLSLGQMIKLMTFKSVSVCKTSRIHYLHISQFFNKQPQIILELRAAQWLIAAMT